jgi:hypothetical protein
MTIEQTIEIPENHRLFFDIPRNIPSGRAKVALTVTPESSPGMERAGIDLRLPQPRWEDDCKREWDLF